MSLFNEKSVGLALGGGAARGFAHIGVLKVLHEEGIRPAFVAGTSVGSLVGSLYCAGYEWYEIRDITGKLRWKDLVQITFPRKGLVKTENMEKLARELLGGKTFADLPIPFKAVTVDLSRGEEYVIGEGPVAPAVRASSSIPGIFEPLIQDDRVLVDGGVMNGVPADVVRDMGADVVIAVDLNGENRGYHPPDTLLDIILQSFMQMVRNNSLKGSEFSDYLIQPDLTNFSYYNLSQVEPCIEKGEEAAREIIRQIRRKVRPLFSFSA
jgi:NTE family protein